MKLTLTIEMKIQTWERQATEGQLSWKLHLVESAGQVLGIVKEDDMGFTIDERILPPHGINYHSTLQKAIIALVEQEALPGSSIVEVES